MTAVKAKLMVILKADEVVVAEVEDPVLWQHALTVIHGGKPELPGPNLGARALLTNCRSRRTRVRMKKQVT